jgi:hypothetical protein
MLNLRSLSSDNRGSTTAERVISFNIEFSPSHQAPANRLEALWIRTLGDFTEDNGTERGESASDEVVPHPVKVTHYGQDYSHQEV